MPTLFTALVLVTAAVSHARAQAAAITCRDDQTIAECLAAFRPVGGAPLTDTDRAHAAALVGLAHQRLQGQAAGPDVSSEGSLSAINDFLPRLAASLIAPTTGATPDFGFKTNLPLNDGVLLRAGVTLQFTTVFPPAKLTDRFADSLSAPMRKALEGGLGPFDDAQLTGSLNLENRRWRRAKHRAVPSRHRPDRVCGGEASMFRWTARGTGGGSISGQLRRSLQDDLKNGVQGIVRPPAPANCQVKTVPGGPGVPGFSDLPVTCLTPETRARVELAISAIVEAAGQYIRERSDELRATGFTSLSRLVNNQPQLNAGWEYNARRSLAGPSQWTGKARVEWGFANMNGLRHHCNGTVALGCLQTYLQTPSVRGSLARADRVFAQVDFTRRAAWHVSIPEDSFDIRLGSATSLALSAGYGAYFGNADQGENRDRLDLQGKYDFTRDDALRQDRFVGTLFYTRRVSESASALFGITWANRPEFLGDVTRRLGANIGFTYKLNNGDAQK